MITLETVASVDSMTDKTKAYVMNDTIWKYEARYDVILPTNEIPKSINSDGTAYNDEQGWKSGYYIDAGSGAEKASSYYECTGFIPVVATDTFRIEGYTSEGTVYDNITFYDSSFSILGAFTGSSNYNPLSQFVQDDGSMEVCIATATTTNFTDVKKNSIAYMRLSFAKIDNDTSCFINTFEETTVLQPASWYDTKIPYYGEYIIEYETILKKIKRYMGLHV